VTAQLAQTAQQFAPQTLEQRMSQAGKTFYRAARLLPAPLRGNVVALYAFCRTVDDLADDPSRPQMERRRGLEALGMALDRGDVSELYAAGWPFTSNGVLAQAAGMLVRAAIMDLDQQQPESIEDLLAYAFGVAGTVGVMMAEILQARPEGYGAAVALGMAMQLSNICRDVAEDLHAGRIYLPSKLSPADAVRRAVDLDEVTGVQQTQAAVQHLLVRADTLYEIAFDGMWTLPWRVRWSILAAGLCYRQIGVQVGRDIRRSWQRRTVVATGRKLWLIALAGARLLLPRHWQARHTGWAKSLGPGALEAGHMLGLVQGIDV
jgi:phytoene synthase